VCCIFLEARFDARGLHVVSDVPDGNCLLRSVFPGLQSQVGSVHELRVILVHSLNRHWSDYAHLFPATLTNEDQASMLAKLKTDGEWDQDTMDLAFSVLAREFNVGMRLRDDHSAILARSDTYFLRSASFQASKS